MADGNNIGFFQQLWRFFTFYKLRKSLGLARAADRQFTTSAQGIEDAGTIKLMKLQQRAKDFFSALSGVETAIELKKGELKQMRDNKAILTRKRNGAAVVIDQQTKLLEKVTSDEAKAEVQGKIDRAMADGQSFSEQVKKIAEDEPALAQFITDKQKELAPLETQLKKLNQEIKDLPAQTKEKAARFCSNQQMLDAYKRMNNLNSPLEHDPMDAVDDMLRQQDAEVKVAGRITVNTTDTTGEEYLQAGSQEDGANDFDQFLKARKADKEAKTGEGTTAQTEDRPKI